MDFTLAFLALTLNDAAGKARKSFIASRKGRSLSAHHCGTAAKKLVITQTFARTA